MRDGNMSYFSKDADPATILQEMTEDEVISTIEKARELVCNKAKQIEVEVEAKRDEMKARNEIIKTLKEDHSFLLNRLTDAEAGLRRKDEATRVNGQ